MEIVVDCMTAVNKLHLFCFLDGIYGIYMVYILGSY